jgi:hypothetical protein
MTASRSSEAPQGAKRAPTSRRTHLAVAAFSLAIAALGVVFIIGGAVVTRLLGGFFIVTAAVIYGSLLFRARTPLPVARSVVIDDERALFLPRSQVAATANCVLAATMTLFFVGWGVALGLDRGWFAGLWVSIPGLVFLMLPVFALTGRWKAGGIWLTPTRLVHHAYGVRGWTTWDDIAKVDPPPVDTSVQRAPVSGVHTRTAHGEYTTPFFRNGKLDSAGRLTLDLRELPATPAEVVRLVSTYWEKPELRRELGQDAAVARVANPAYRSGRT